MYKVSIDGLDRLEKLPAELSQAGRAFLIDAIEDLKDEVASVAPGGAAGSVGRSFFADIIIPAAVARIASDHPGAKALDKGAYIRRTGWRPVRFYVGGQAVFARWVRLKPLRYMQKGLRHRNAIVGDAFERHFGVIGEEHVAAGPSA